MPLVCNLVPRIIASNHQTYVAQTCIQDYQKSGMDFPCLLSTQIFGRLINKRLRVYRRTLLRYCISYSELSAAGTCSLGYTTVLYVL